MLGVRESAINRAEGLRQSKILASEAMRIEQVNKAKGKSCVCISVRSFDEQARQRNYRKPACIIYMYVWVCNCMHSSIFFFF